MLISVAHKNGKSVMVALKNGKVVAKSVKPLDSTTASVRVRELNESFHAFFGKVVDIVRKDKWREGETLVVETHSKYIVRQHEYLDRILTKQHSQFFYDLNRCPLEVVFDSKDRPIDCFAYRYLKDDFDKEEINEEAAEYKLVSDDSFWLV